MANRNKLVVLIAVLTAVLGASGCKDPYGACAKAGADIASGVSAGMTTVQGLQAQGVISSAEALDTLGYLEYANKADEAFLSCISAAHTSPAKSGAFTSCATIFNTTLNNPQQLALVHVSNSKASATITTIVEGLTTAVNAIVSGLKGA